MTIWRRLQQFIKTSLTDVSVSLWRRRLIATVLAVAFVVPSVALAQEAISDSVETAGNELGLIDSGVLQDETDIRGVVVRIIQWLLGVVGLIAVCVIIYGGYLYMTAAGRPERVEESKTVIRNGVIGLTIIVASYAIVSIIINLLFGGDGSGSGSTGGGFTGCQNCIARGGGLVEDHYPDWNERVSRDIDILVTFSEQIFVVPNGDSDEDKSFIQDAVLGDGSNGCPVGWWCGVADSDKFVISYLNENDPQGPPLETYDEDIKAYVDTELRRFVLDPTTLLGRVDGDGAPIVTLTRVTLQNIKTQASPDGLNSAYSWNFTVTEQIDATPPRVMNIEPLEGVSVARNKVISIRFSEPVHPIAVTGQQDTDGGIDFDNIEVYRKDTQGKVDGRFFLGNGYKDVWFIPEQVCTDTDGDAILNSCNDQIYCLPSSADVRVVAKTATLKNQSGGAKPFEAQTPPPSGNNLYDGVIDLSKNALDGSRDAVLVLPSGNGAADGRHSGGDNVVTRSAQDLQDTFVWDFKTTDAVFNSPPGILSLDPAPDAESVSVTEPFTATFNRTLIPPTNYRFDNKNYPPARIYQQVSATPESWSVANLGYYLRQAEVRVCSNNVNTACTSNTDCGAGNTCSAVCGDGALLQCSSDAQCGANNACGRMKLNIQHSGLVDPNRADIPRVTYEPRLGSTIQDTFQNCFYVPETTPNTAGSFIKNELYGPGGVVPDFDRDDVNVNRTNGVFPNFQGERPD